MKRQKFESDVGNIELLVFFDVYPLILSALVLRERQGISEYEVGKTLKSLKLSNESWAGHWTWK